MAEGFALLSADSVTACGVEFARAFGDLFPHAAKANGAILIPYLLKDVGGIEKMNQPDFIHPTAEGQRKVAENVWAVLKGVLAAPVAP